MKHVKGVCLFTVVILLSFLFSCGKKDKMAKENEISFDSIRIEASQHLFNDTSKPNCNLDMRFTFPVKYSNKEVLTKIQQKFIESFLGEDYKELTAQNAAEQFKKDYLEEYKNREKEYLEDQERKAEDEIIPSRWYSYYKSGNIDIYYNKANILSCIFFIDSFYGGNNSEKNFIYVTFDLTNGNTLKEEDLFIDNYEDELNKLIFNTLAEKNQAKDEHELIQMGYFGATELASNENFIIDEKGITYLYNEREIASELLGSIQVFLPYEKLESILKEGTLVSQFIN